MKGWNATAPRSSAICSNAGRYCTLSLVIVLLICTSTPASRQLRTPRTAPSKAPGTPRNSIVLRGAREVDRDAHAGDADVLDAARDLRRDERAVGRHHRAQALADGVLGDVEDVGAHQRIAAGEDEDGAGERGDLIDEGEGLGGAELALVGPVHGRSTAVHAGEIAAARDLPGDDRAAARGLWRRRAAHSCREGSGPSSDPAHDVFGVIRDDQIGAGPLDAGDGLHDGALARRASRWPPPP